MQAVKMPNGIIEDLEKFNRDFFWGHDQGGKKLHTLSWEKLCQPKDYYGELGFQRLKEINQAFMTKLAWRFQFEEDLLWTQVLNIKYGSISKSWENIIYMKKTKQEFQISCSSFPLGAWER